MDVDIIILENCPITILLVYITIQYSTIVKIVYDDKCHRTISVQDNGGLLPDITLLTQGYYHRGTRLNTMQWLCLCSLCNSILLLCMMMHYYYIVSVLFGLVALHSD